MSINLSELVEHENRCSFNLISFEKQKLFFFQMIKRVVFKANERIGFLFIVRKKNIIIFSHKPQPWSKHCYQRNERK